MSAVSFAYKPVHAKTNSPTPAQPVKEVVNEETSGPLENWDLGPYPLHDLARRGAVVMLKFLIDEKHNVNSLDKGGHTPLCMAAWANQGEAIQTLLKAGGKLNAMDKSVFPQLAERIAKMSAAR